MVYSEIRKKARESLKNKWSKAICMVLANISIVLLFIFIEGISTKIFGNQSIITSVIQILYLIIEVALNFGFVFSLIKLKKDENVKAYDFIQIGFNNFSNAWGLSLRLFFKMLIPFIILIFAISFILAGSIFIMRTGIAYLFETGYMNEMELKVGIVLCGIGVIGCLIDSIMLTILSLAYSQRYFIAYENPEMTSKEIIKTSAKMMKGHKGQLFILELSFIGWILLSILSMGIGFIWLYPYMMFATMCFYDVVSEEYKKQEKIENKTE